MARQQVDTGTQGNDGTGDSIRESFRKVNDNFRELYAIIGGGDTIGFVNLDDVSINKRTSLGTEVSPVQAATSFEGYANHVVAVNSVGTALRLKTIAAGSGINIDNSNPNAITITNISGNVSADTTPLLAAPLNANTFTIGNIANPDNAALTLFNTIHGTTVSLNTLAVNKGYADTTYVAKSGGTMTGALNVPAGATGTQVPRRNEVVSKAGDSMTGALNLHDHPGGLAGQISTDPEGLRAATKYYVDNNSFASSVNLFVATTGDDAQANTPAGKDGGSFSYAYATIGAACARAEDLIELGKEEPGPYRQLLIYTQGLEQTATEVSTNTFLSGNSTSLAYTDATFLLNQNRTFIEAEAIAWLGLNFPNLVYNSVAFAQNILNIVDSVIIDMTTGGNYQSRNIGKNYYRDADAIIERTVYPVETLSAINRIKTISAQIVQNTVVAKTVTGIAPNTQTQVINGIYNNVSGPAVAYQNSLFTIVTDIVTNIANAPLVNFGTGLVEISFSNGGNGFVDQGNDTNLDITPGKIIRGMTSGATAVITEYAANEDSTNFDFIRCRLLRAPINFVIGEQLEFGEPNIELQITIKIESGIYYEDLPIKVPTNVTLKGDEFRRCIVRPRDRISQSQWARTYFYRDGTFDGLLIGNIDYSVNYATSVTLTPSDTSGNINFTLSSGIADRLWINKVLIAANGKAIITNVSGANISATVFEQLSNTFAVPSGEWFIYDTFNYGYHYLSNPTDPVFTGSISGNNLTVTSVSQGVLLPGTVIYGTGIATGTTIVDTKFVGEITATTLTVTEMINGPIRIGQELTGTNIPFGTTVSSQLTGSTGGIGTYTVDTSSAVVTGSISGTTLTVTGVTAGVLIAGQVITGGTITPGTIVSGNVTGLGGVGTYTVNISQTVTSTTITSTISSTTIEASGSGVGNTGVYTVSISQTVGSTTIRTSPKNNKDLDMFLWNDAGKMQNMTGQGMGGFMCVLDPAGLVGSKSPYFQSNSCFTQSINKQAFRGGMYIDGFVGRLQANITNASIDGLELTLSGLTYRAPLAPCAFYDNGSRFQVDYIKSYDSTTGIAVVELNDTTPWNSSNVGIILETPGNRSMLANDFTQVNDLGYGIVANNTGLTEQVSTFTYYCYTAYYAVNGGQIRSIAGSNSHGKYGLRSIGSDPTEIPDAVTLMNPLSQAARVYKLAPYGAEFTATISGTTMTVSAVSYGELLAGQTVRGTGVTNSTLIDSQSSGTTGGVGVYILTVASTVAAATTMTASSFMNATATSLFVYAYDYKPTNTSELEIDHGGAIGILRYEINSIQNTATTFGGDTVIQLNLSTAANDNRTSTGLGAFLTHNQVVAIRTLTNFKVDGVENVQPVRPSTALQFDNQFTFVYRTIAYNLTESTGELLPGDQAILTSDAPYSFVRVNTDGNDGRTADPIDAGKTMGFTAGDTRIAIEDITEVENISRINAGDLVTVWSGKTHKVTSYVPEAFGTNQVITGATQANPCVITAVAHGLVSGDSVRITGVSGMTQLNDSIYWITKLTNDTFELYVNQNRITGVNSAVFAAYTTGGVVRKRVPTHIIITDESDKNVVPTAVGIATGFPTSAIRTLRIGADGGTTGVVTVRISTCRATSHDFLDVGTGGFNTTNYPNITFGSPAQAAVQSQEVFEETVGRVFFVSTDQYGIFRVGRFFTVDQGTGTVTFSAAIALSNLDGLGFKRGVVVSEFSTDNTMTANSSDTVPTQSATRGYIDKRLGLDHSGISVGVGDRIGPGFLPLNGLNPMNGALQMGNNRIQGLANPVSSTDAATKDYVDTLTAAYDEFEELNDVYLLAPTIGEIPVFLGAGNAVTNAPFAGNINSTVTYSTATVLQTAIADTLPISGSLTVTSSTGFDGAGGRFVIGGEVFSYSNISPANVLNGITRGLMSTTSTTHSIGSAVSFIPSAALTLSVAPLSLTNAEISATAAIDQSKLLLNDATTSTKGIASFSSTNFAVASGVVTVKANGIALSNLATISDASVLANFTGGAAVPAATAPETVVTRGLSNMFSSTGVVTLTATGSPTDTFGITTVSASATNNTLSLRDSSGRIDTTAVLLNGSEVLSYSSTTLKVKTPGGVEIISATGGAAASTPVTLTGQFTLGASSTLVASSATTAGSATTATTATQADSLLWNAAYRSAASTATANTIAARDASGDLYANLFQGTATSARYADLAEYYSADTEYEPGTVLIFGGDSEVTISKTLSDTKLAGVVTTNAAYMMNSDLAGTRAGVALQGRVPCKVVGRVKKGEMLTTSAVAGHATRSLDPKIGTIIGKALEDKDYSEAGVIEVAVGRV
jgi:hypothetical protein